ncbi:hypothetical protein XANCAGTX0491_001643 [Xanthoria calcicola]
MRSTSLTVKALACLAAGAASVSAQLDYYFNFGSSAVVQERLDPLVNPGALAGHVHSVVGGNAFAATMDFGTTQSSSCTSVDLIADKSNYWMPSLYFHKNGKFTLVPERSPKHKIYYKYGDRGQPGADRSEFPKGFRMMAGNANLRSDDGSLGSAGSQLQWYCHGPEVQSAGIPKGFTSCPHGLAAAMRFPSCWNGQDFNKDQPLAHMAYPTTGLGLIDGCPAGFQKARFPEIFIEFWLEVSQFDGQYGANESPFVLANGDPTGYGFHMDFLNGWEEGVLARAMRTCRPGNTGDPLDSPQCFGAGSVQNGDAKERCKKPTSVNEDIGLNGPLSQLPGCNPIQAGPGLATKPANCPGGAGVRSSTSGPSPATSATTAGLAQTTTSSPPVSPTTSAAAGPRPTDTVPPSGGSSELSPPSVNSTSGMWKAAGCFLDALNPRSLGSRPQWWGQKISSSNCVERCDSIRAKYAGTENGGQCFCGNELLNSASHPGKCTSKCDGDGSEICGGPGHLSIYSRDGLVSVKKRRTHRRHIRHFSASV